MKRHSISSRTVAVMAALLLPGALWAADWPQWRGPNRDGKSAETGLLKAWPAGGPKQVWKKSGIGSGYSSATVANGMVYITGDVGGQLTVTALDANGQDKWTAAVGNAYQGNRPGTRSSCVIDGGRLYIISGLGAVACLDAAKGSKVWTRSMKEFGGRQPQWAYAESVLIRGNLAVITPGGRTPMVALDKKTGKTVWKSSGFAARAHYSSPIAVTYQGVPMIIQGTGDGIFAVDPGTGKTLWSNGWCKGNTANCPMPAFSDGYVFWANGYGKGGICLKLSVADGTVKAEEAWTTTEMVSHHGGYVILDGFIYGNHGNGWACLDLRTGQRKWFERGVGKGSLTYADGMLYLFGERGGRAGLLPATTGAPAMKGGFSVSGKGTSWAHPVVANGRLYLRYDDTLYCFDVKAD